jgi:hypothetical protein
MDKSDDHSIISPESIESQALSSVRRSLINTIGRVNFPVLLDGFADFIVRNDGEPLNFTLHKEPWRHYFSPYSKGYK